MKSRPVYVFMEGGSVIISIEAPKNTTYKTISRLYPDEGKILTKDGEEFHWVVDTENPEEWYEVDIEAPVEL